MEVSGVVIRQIPCLPGSVTDSRVSLLRSFTSSRNRFSGKLSVLGNPPNMLSDVGLSYEFADRGHLQYYCKPTTRCGSKGECVKEEKKKIKKRAKMIKGLTKDLNMFSSMGFGLDSEAGLVGEVQNKNISEAADILLKQLEKLKAEEKELKRQKKEEKAKAKAMKMKTMLNDSSSSSSESSDSECDQVIDMSSQRNQSLLVMQPTGTQLLQPVHQQTAIATLPVLTNPEENMAKTVILEGCYKGSSIACDDIMRNKNNVVDVSVSNEKRIEVCMGGKCKKSGGVELLEEFQRAMMGVEGSAVGCKCMGKCKSGPNVRVVNQNDGLSDSLRTPSNPLYIGVGLQDVAAIVSGLIGEECSENTGLPAA